MPGGFSVPGLQTAITAASTVTVRSSTAPVVGAPLRGDNASSMTELLSTTELSSGMPRLRRASDVAALLAAFSTRLAAFDTPPARPRAAARYRPSSRGILIDYD